MSNTTIVISTDNLERKTRQAGVTIVRTLDRFASRAAQEFVREEKQQAPKAFTTLTNSIAARKNGYADYTANAGAKYAKWVNDGTRPHTPPLKPLMEWLRLTKRVTDPDELFNRARGLQRFIAAHGTKANPFVARTRQKMQGRVMALLHKGVRTATQEAFQK